MRSSPLCHFTVPPSHPPPSHLLPSLNAKPSDFTLSSSTSSLPLLAVSKSLKSLPPSSSTSSHEAAGSERPVILKAAPGSQKTKVPLPESTSAASASASSKEKPETSEDKPLFMKTGWHKVSDSKASQGLYSHGVAEPSDAVGRSFEDTDPQLYSSLYLYPCLQLCQGGVACSELQAI